MPSIRSEGDLVYASSAACDLAALMHRFLVAYRTHCNGVNGIKIPDEFVVVLKMPEQLNETVFICCTLIYTHVSVWSEPQYYSPDDDQYQESFGGYGDHNVSHYVSNSSSSIEKSGVKVPWNLLILSDAALAVHCQTLATKDKAAKAEVHRIEQIARLRKELAKLETLPKS